MNTWKRWEICYKFTLKTSECGPYITPFYGVVGFEWVNVSWGFGLARYELRIEIETTNYELDFTSWKLKSRVPSLNYDSARIKSITSY